ncbi:MAG: hypothetical protein H0W84_12735 [Bacteroidetes bacterium]|nr:hypothetical protein [Bacteroidota bacterium]
MHKYLSICFLLPFILITSSCVKEKNYPTEPVIKFKSFTHSGMDSANVIISFTDGDGDIGLTQKDTSGEFNSQSKYYYNFYMRYFYKASDGSFKSLETAPGDTLDYTYRIPKLLEDGQQRKALSGDIKVKLYAPIAIHDTVQYEIYIYDKAFHKSNVVNTGTIILN